jgi:hypothetical protein
LDVSGRLSVSPRWLGLHLPEITGASGVTEADRFDIMFETVVLDLIFLNGRRYGPAGGSRQRTR